MDLELAQKLADDCMSDGVKLGFRFAIDALREAKSEVPVENQTWDHAMVTLQIFEMENLSEFQITR